VALFTYNVAGAILGVIFKKHEWDWRKAARRAQVIEHYINNFVYSRIASALWYEIKKKNSKNAAIGKFKSKTCLMVNP
jgi:hypothetical protein